MSHCILPSARVDVLRAEARLEAEHPGYGDAFTGEFVAAIRAVTANPRQYPLVPDGRAGVEAREYFIRRFNYRVIFVIDGPDVVFVAVHHARRRPGTWRRRLAGLD